MQNPHYKNMGNLYGSEFWTYLLPPRVGADGARAIMQHRLPMPAAEAVASGFYDACLPAPGFAVDAQPPLYLRDGPPQTIFQLRALPGATAERSPMPACSSAE